MLSDASRIGNATQEIFDRQFWLASGRAQHTPAGRGDALFIEHEGQSWVLRHYRRGGWMARLCGDRYAWTGAARTRPFLEWRLLAELHREGLPVPAPVAARYQRHGLTYTGDLITVRIADAQPLSSLLAERPAPPRLWADIGRCIRRFHDAGVFHADLNAHNILINGEGQVFVIDFDRGRRRSAGRWKRRNLLRLKRSLDKIARRLPQGRVRESEWQELLTGYEARL